MSEYAALHNVYLLLVGNNIQIRESLSSSESFELESLLSDPIPDDELFIPYKDLNTEINEDQQERTGIETILQPMSENGVFILIEDVASGPDARWRTHGLDRRRAILEDDLRLGGRNFSLSFDCSVQRYYSIAHRALEEFHHLYQRSLSSIQNQQELEEIYVMGYRIVSFLAECLPNHPRLKRSPFVIKQSETELKHLRMCLEDVALRIDGIVCNETVDDGDNYLDMIIAKQMEQVEDDDDDEERIPIKSDHPKRSSSSSDFEVTPFQLQNWVNFDDFKTFEDTNSKRKKEPKLSESSTSDTVGTTGTDSSDDISSSSSQSKSPDRRRSKSKKHDIDCDDFDSIIRGDNGFKNHYPPHWDDESLKSYSSQPFTLLRKSANIDFLKKVACEPVLFESDSDADDSWANGDSKSQPCQSSSSGEAPTSDPARLAFRTIMDHLPLQCQSPPPPPPPPLPQSAKYGKAVPKSIKSPINSPKRFTISNVKLPLKPIFKGNCQMPSESSIHNEPPPEATDAPTASPTRFNFPDVIDTLPLKCMVKENDQTLSESSVDIQSESPSTVLSHDLVCSMFPDIMEDLPQESLLNWNCQSRSESPTFSDVDDDILDQVVEDEIQAYLEETENQNSGKEVQPSVQTDRRIAEPEQKETRQQQQCRESPPGKAEKEEVGTEEFRRRKLDQKLDEQQQEIEQQCPSTTVQSAVPTFKSSDSAKRASKKKRSVSFDEASISTASTASTSMGNSTTTPSSQTFGSLRGATSIGSQTSAFSVYSRSKTKQQYEYKIVTQDQPFDEVQEDWINFQSGSGFFSR